MRQVLHICKKDVRRLWLPLVGLLALFAGRAWLDGRPPSRSILGVSEGFRLDGILQTLTIMLPIAICFVIAFLVLQEALAGDDQFWLTRPYQRWKLLAAKVFTVVLFINVPLLLSDCYILGHQHLPVLSAYREILARQIPLTSLFILPSLVLAAVSIGMAQFVLMWFLVFLAVLLQILLVTVVVHGTEAAGSTSAVMVDPNMWLVCIIGIACAIVVWQYATRQARVARVILLVLVLLIQPITIGLSFLLQLVFPRTQHSQSVSQAGQSVSQPGVSVEYDPGRELKRAGTSDAAINQVLRIPLRVRGVAADSFLRGSGMVAIESSGKAWVAANSRMGSIALDRDGSYWEEIAFDMAKPIALPPGRATVRTEFNMEIISNRPGLIVPLINGDFQVPRFGVCGMFQQVRNMEVKCRAGVGERIETAVRLHDDPNRLRDLMITSPGSTAWGLSPVSELGSLNLAIDRKDMALEFVPHDKVSTFVRTVEVNVPDLAEWVMRP